MLFLAEMEVALPPDMDGERADERKARERAQAQDLQRDGRWRHLWRVAGRYANVSVFDLASPDELHELLSALPLFPSEVRTIVPAPYMIPLDGPTGQLCAAAGWSPWRPAHIHLIVSADDHEPLTTQLFIDSSDNLDNDVASAVKDELIVRPRLAEHTPDLSFEYDFTLAPVRAATAVG